MTAVLEACGLVCGYDEREVLHGIDLALGSGDLLGVIGPNGSGKSTLIRALTGVLPVKGGVVRIEGRPLHGYSRRALAQKVAVVPQPSLPLFTFTVREMVEMGRHPHLGRFEGQQDEDQAIIDEALAVTDVVHLQDRGVDQLSAGELQRVVIARALAQQTEILLLDEPTAHLDISHQLEIFALLARLNTERGLSVLCISHDLNLAAEFCQRLVLISRGTVAASGRPDEVITEEHLRQVYGVEVHVETNRYSGQPLVIFSRGAASEAKE